MVDEAAALKVIDEFLNDDSKRTLLIKGFDNEAKLRATLKSLNKIFKAGIIKCSSMKDIADFVNDALGKKVLPRSVKSTTSYKIGRMTIGISSYATHTQDNYRGNENTFTIFHPVQTVLDDPRRNKRFVEELKETKSKKIIINTTNEWGIDNWDIEAIVDEVYFYSVENDNAYIMKNLRQNGAVE